jgi:hypothetical protein
MVGRNRAVRGASPHGLHVSIAADPGEPGRLGLKQEYSARRANCTTRHCRIDGGWNTVGRRMSQTLASGSGWSCSGRRRRRAFIGSPHLPTRGPPVVAPRVSSLPHSRLRRPQWLDRNNHRNVWSENSPYRSKQPGTFSLSTRLYPSVETSREFVEFADPCGGEKSETSSQGVAHAAGPSSLNAGPHKPTLRPHPTLSPCSGAGARASLLFDRTPT